jgi:crossover junction endodeoxyribonuclease RusA
MISFFVPGRPAQQGSKRHLGNGVMVESNPNLKPWRQLVSLVAKSKMNGRAPSMVPVRVLVDFFFQRPKGHYGTGSKSAVLKAGSPEYMSSAPDVDKLLRGILDALTGICYGDDRQVSIIAGTKKYGIPGAQIQVMEIQHG